MVKMFFNLEQNKMLNINFGLLCIHSITSRLISYVSILRWLQH